MIDSSKISLLKHPISYAHKHEHSEGEENVTGGHEWQHAGTVGKKRRRTWGKGLNFSESVLGRLKSTRRYGCGGGEFVLNSPTFQIVSSLSPSKHCQITNFSLLSSFSFPLSHTDSSTSLRPSELCAQNVVWLPTLFCVYASSHQERSNL